MTQRRLHRRLAVTIATVTGWLLCAPTLQAQELHASWGARMPARTGSFSLKIEPGLAFPLTSPQSDLFNVGGGETIKGLFALTPFLDIGPSATFIGLPADAANTNAGPHGKRCERELKRRITQQAPHSKQASVGGVDCSSRTADLDPPGFFFFFSAAGAGLALPSPARRGILDRTVVRFTKVSAETQRSMTRRPDLSLGLASMWLGVEREP